jgi:2-hydroxy-3-keto-5-methylthiopentenyl-1-phosphate phosphatase
MTNGLMVFSDFDATISNIDVTDAILEAFAESSWREIEEEWISGRIGSRECMRRQIALLRCSKEQMNEYLSTMTIDPYFSKFVTHCSENEIPVAVVSDGLDYAIHYLLRNHGVLDLPIFANHLLHVGDNALRLAFPYADNQCLKSAGVCKCKVMADLAGTETRTVYVGDGTSDFCAAGKADLVFAKDKLLDFCREQGIPHLPFRNFSDVLHHLQPGETPSPLIPGTNDSLNHIMELRGNA